MSTTQTIFEIIGIIGFAMSGTMVALQNKMDVVGAVILANVTALGGGVLRDLVIGHIPPHLFNDPFYLVYVAIATGVSILLMVAIALFKPFKQGVKSEAFNLTINVMDAIGIAPFSIVGAKMAMETGHGFSALMLAVIGCFSSCCGGIFRDILAHRIPTVFRKYLYLIPCFVGTITYVLLAQYTSVWEPLAFIIGSAIIIGGRFAGMFFKINMPSVRIDEPDKEQNKK